MGERGGGLERTSPWWGSAATQSATTFAASSGVPCSDCSIYKAPQASPLSGSSVTALCSHDRALSRFRSAKNIWATASTTLASLGSRFSASMLRDFLAVRGAVRSHSACRIPESG